MQLLVRFFVGGLTVSLLAVIGDVIRPKSFAGVFGAAPSVALGTIALTVASEGSAYAAIEARSMIIGAGALLGYTWLSCRVLWTTDASAPTVTLGGLLGWLVLAALGWALFLSPLA